MPFLKQSIHYEGLESLACALKKLFVLSDLKISPGSELDQTINGLLKLSSWWKAGHTSPGPSIQELARGMCGLRLASSALFLDPKKHYSILRKLQKGSLLFWNNERSEAKDTEWEVNAWAHLSEANLAPLLAEPDLQVTLKGVGFGLACKRLYSESNANKQISKGVKQIRHASIPGIVCLAIDSLVQPDVDVAVLKVQTINDAREALQGKLDLFRRMKEGHVVPKYFTNGRLAGIILTIQAFADIAETEERAIHCQESLVWTAESVSREQRDCLKFLHEKLVSAMIPWEKIITRANELLAL